MTSRTGKLAKSPLAHVIASVRFAPWPRLAKHIDEIQDDLREIAPLMNVVQLEQVGPDGQAVGTPRQSWVLVAPDNSFSIQFAQDQILIHAYKYGVYSDFDGILKKSLSTLLNYMKFVDVMTMGVRYIDYVKPINGEPISEYVSDKLLAPSFSNHKSVGGQATYEYKVADDVRLRVNALSLPGSPRLSQDVWGVVAMDSQPPGNLKIELLGENELTLDMDAILVHPSPQRLDLESIMEKMHSLHAIANGFFRQEDVFTDYAFKVWKGE